MRAIIIVAGLLLVGCNSESGSTTKQSALSVDEGSVIDAPTSADTALRAFYAGQDINFPKASAGPALPASNTVITRIAFGSCQASWKPILILDQVVADDPDIFIYLGDNVYGDERAGNALMPNLRQQYADLAALPEFQRLRTQTPMMSMWDDHDYGLNDGGGDFAFKHFAEKAFLEFWNEPADSIRRKRDGLYDAKLFGVDGQRVQIIMLDTRFFRSSPLVPTDERGAKGKERYLPSNDPNMTILGDVQWKWFEQQLQEKADIRFIVTSIQVLAADHGWESWREFTPQRDKFFTTVEQSGAKGVVIISGDRHVAAFYEKKNSDDYSLYEFTSSPLNMSFTKDPKEYDALQIVDAVGINNYGLIDIDWQNRKLIMQIKDIDGGVQRELQVPFTKLGL